MIQEEKLKLIGWRWRWIYEDGSVVEEENYIPNAGLSILAALICGEQDNVCSWHIAWGTGTTAAADSDTTLETESGRKAKTSLWRESYTVKVRAYLITSEANGTFTEWGLFVAGTNFADTGELASRVLPTGGVTKTAAQVMTVEIDITLARG
jgi:hypothetical protein